uniref:Uncharacterized protein n=1 Tax=Dunaliella tertiolecta TaxID=3047 RepID=A0A7S3QPK4_DUNTE
MLVGKHACSPSTGAREKGGICRMHSRASTANLPLISATAATLLLAAPAGASSEQFSLSQYNRILDSTDASTASSTVVMESPVARIAAVETAPLLDDLGGNGCMWHGCANGSQLHASTSHLHASTSIPLPQLPLASLLESLSQPLPYYVYGLEAGAATVAALAIWMWQVSFEARG